MRVRRELTFAGGGGWQKKTNAGNGTGCEHGQQANSSSHHSTPEKGRIINPSSVLTANADTHRGGRGENVPATFEVFLQANILGEEEFHVFMVFKTFFIDPLFSHFSNIHKKLSAYGMANALFLIINRYQCY
jgi:hypothetical protein